MSLEAPKTHQPFDDEPHITPQLKEEIRQILMDWRNQLLQKSNGTITHLQKEPQAEADLVDCAANETDRTIELHTRDLERKLLNGIDEAFRRLEDGSYGYCEETGEPISIERLKARPIATLSLEAQERHERLERLQRNDH